MSQHPSSQDHTMRDAETLILLGGFVCVLALFVLVGTIFAVRTHGMVVNFAAGVVLAGIGAAFLWRGLGIRKLIRASSDKQ